MLLTATLLAAALQVGPNPTATDTLGPPDELLNRPPREDEAAALSDNPQSAWLASCLALLPDEAARAHSLAQLRRNETSAEQRVLANHCLGLAATQLELWDDAVAAFIAARDGSGEGDTRVRARFGAMAGNAAFAAGDVAQARAFLSQAKADARAAASAPLRAIAATDLARVLVSMDEPDAALAELDEALELQPENADTWLLKATLLRRMERLGEAQAAIEQASTHAPRAPAIGLEAGVIAVLTGREDAARESWQSLIDLAPESPAALAAQDYLAQLGPPPIAPAPATSAQPQVEAPL
ncbi:tetratricopeptide repeat protein [Erythrobacter sp.]|jgi:tetratricopeptide (TPR) repeat protein|uniref:tetratricopeptide repeat protein n=1 Tax=Erythrobacter sp. TaxID=1042 RepID=UPI002EA75E22|nr:tetratricopeptide repeat protein [Erythrobacter sp.]